MDKNYELLRGYLIGIKAPEEIMQAMQSIQDGVAKSFLISEDDPMICYPVRHNTGSVPTADNSTTTIPWST